jgi:hypothetical protein
MTCQPKVADYRANLCLAKLYGFGPTSLGSTELIVFSRTLTKSISVHLWPHARKHRWKQSYMLIQKQCNLWAPWNHPWIHWLTTGVLTPNVPVHLLAGATLDVQSSMMVHRMVEDAGYVLQNTHLSILTNNHLRMRPRPCNAQGSGSEVRTNNLSSTEQAHSQPPRPFSYKYPLASYSTINMAICSKVKPCNNTH